MEHVQPGGGGCGAGGGDCAATSMTSWLIMNERADGAARARADRRTTRVIAVTLHMKLHMFARFVRASRHCLLRARRARRSCNCREAPARYGAREATSSSAAAMTELQTAVRNTRLGLPSLSLSSIQAALIWAAFTLASLFVATFRAISKSGGAAAHPAQRDAMARFVMMAAIFISLPTCAAYGVNQEHRHNPAGAGHSHRPQSHEHSPHRHTPYPP